MKISIETESKDHFPKMFELPEGVVLTPAILELIEDLKRMDVRATLIGIEAREWVLKCTKERNQYYALMDSEMRMGLRPNQHRPYVIRRDDYLKIVWRRAALRFKGAGRIESPIKGFYGLSKAFMEGLNPFQVAFIERQELEAIPLRKKWLGVRRAAYWIIFLIGTEVAKQRIDFHIELPDYRSYYRW